MDFVKYISTVFIFSIMLWSCGNQAVQNDAEDKVDPHDHAHETDNAAARLSQEQINTVGITFGHVERKQLTAVMKANGRLRVPNHYQANATSMFGGVVKTLHVQVGDRVTKGQQIASIAHPQFILLQEEYLSIGSRIILAEQELERQKLLNDGNVGTLRNLQTATAELNDLLTRKVSLSQQIQMMGINPVNLTNETLKSALVVTSPIGGVVSNVFARIGSYVDVSSPVVSIVDNAHLHVDLDVFEKDLPLLKVGQIIHFTLTNNPTSEYDARVYSIGASFEDNSKTIAVHCDVIGNKTGLIDGMNITAAVSLNDVTTTAVPNEAIVNADGKDYVFVVEGDAAQKHQHKSNNQTHDHKHEVSLNAENVAFRKVEVIKGVSEMGYTAVNFVTQVKEDAVIVVKGAFFVNATLSYTGEDHVH